MSDPTGWSAIALRPDLRIAVTGRMAPLPADLDAVVAAIWRHARAERPALFNGRVFCADTVAPDRIEGHWTEYRRVLAQMRRAELFDRLRIRPLAVNGLLECANGLVLGRRHAEAVYLPGCWQAAPAGNVEQRPGVDGLDLPGQLLAELEEELGLQAADIVVGAPVLAIDHGPMRIVDLGFLLHTPLGFAEIRTRHRTGGNHEYDQLRLVEPALVDGMLAAPGPMMLPSALMLLEAWRGRPG